MKETENPKKLLMLKLGQIITLMANFDLSNYIDPDTKVITYKTTDLAKHVGTDYNDLNRERVRIARLKRYIEDMRELMTQYNISLDELENIFINEIQSLTQVINMNTLKKDLKV